MNERAIKGVVVDSGHGGNDPGAVNGHVYEKDFKFEKKEVKKNWIDKMCRTMEKIGLTIRNSLIVLLSIVFVAVLVWFANIR